MAVIRDRITVIPPEGETVAVDILEDDVSLGTVHAERATTRMLTLPLSITERTSFFVPAGTGPYDVSVKLGDDEIAGPGGAPVTVSSFPAEIRARVDAAELGSVAGSGGSSQVGDSTYSAENNSPLTLNGLLATTLSDWTEDASAGSDISLDPDGTTFRFATAGLYLIQWIVEFSATNEADAPSDATAVQWLMARTGGHGLSGSADFGPLTPLPASVGQSIKAGDRVFAIRMTADSTLQLKVAAKEASGNEILNYYGVDIFKLVSFD